MPKLILIAPCKRVLVDQGSNGMSLVDVLDGLEVRASEEQARQGVGYVEWAVVTLWHREPSDEGKTFEQRAALQTPDGKESELTTDMFTMPRPNHRCLVNVQGFPIAGTGVCRVKVWLRAHGEKSWGEPRGEFPIIVTVKPPDNEVVEKTH